MSQDARFEDGAERPLNLGALDESDLTVISALAQDAVFPATEMLWRPTERRFALLLNRFRWEDEGRAHHGAERVQSVLVVEGVTAVASQGIDPKDRDTILSLLAVTFVPDAEPPDKIPRGEEDGRDQGEDFGDEQGTHRILTGCIRCGAPLILKRCLPARDGSRRESGPFAFGERRSAGSESDPETRVAGVAAATARPHGRPCWILPILDEAGRSEQEDAGRPFPKTKPRPRRARRETSCIRGRWRPAPSRGAPPAGPAEGPRAADARRWPGPVRG